MSIHASWPRPRVGQKVRLRSGRLVEVILVRTARDVLRGMTEDQAVELGPRTAALYGANWLDVYYEAEVRGINGINTHIVRPNEVETILD